jgi:hypothetical protein
MQRGHMSNSLVFVFCKKNIRKKRNNPLETLKLVRKMQKAIGTRAQVWHGTAHHTSGGLTAGDLFQDKYGNIKSKRASAKAKSQKNLAGYLAPKGSHQFRLAKKKY